MLKFVKQIEINLAFVRRKPRVRKYLALLISRSNQFLKLFNGGGVDWVNAVFFSDVI